MELKINKKLFEATLKECANETLGVSFPKILEDKEFKSLTENLCGYSGETDDEILKECVKNFTCGALEPLRLNEAQLNEFAPVVGMVAVNALRPIVMNMLRKYGLKFFASTYGKKILAKLGCKTMSSAIGKLFGKEMAMKILGRGMGKAAGKGFGNFAKKTIGYGVAGDMVKNAVGGNSGKQDNGTSLIGNYDMRYDSDVVDEAVNKVFKNYFNE